MSLEKHTSKMRVNKNLLPIKGHFFFFNAGTAPLVPYLSTYARQLGFSSKTVGLIYTVLPIFGLVAKPLFGVVADRFKIQKSLFLLFQIVTIVSFAAIYFIPGEQTKVTVGLDCAHGSTVIRSCYDNLGSARFCKVNMLKNQTETAMCKMNCNMSSPKMWQIVCENWHLPEYCYSNTDRIEFTSYLGEVTTKDDCSYISTTKVSLDGNIFTPGCRVGAGHVDLDEPCRMHCVNAPLTKALAGEYVNVTCVDNMLNYRTCNNVTLIEMLPENYNASSCEIYCIFDKSKPWKLMEICKGWNADKADSCHPRTMSMGLFPKNLSFTGAVSLSSTQANDHCIFMQLKHIVLPDGEIRYPYCLSNATNYAKTELFQTSCEISCDNELVNDVFVGAIDSTDEVTSEYTRQFWLFFAMMSISWIGQAVVVTFADAICFNLLGTNVSQYGKQRLWGSVGWGIFSLLTGTLIDIFSNGSVKDYTVAFVLMFVFMTGDVIVSSFLRIESTKMSMSILTDVGRLVSSLPTFIFLLWTIAVGLCTGLLWQFLFWLIEDVSAIACASSDYTKTLQGLVSAIQTFCGEIPFLFVSGHILRKVGHADMMSIVLFAFGVRFLLYSSLTNPWWVLPIEMLQGITFGMFYPTMTSYANKVSPPGTETTVQGLVGAVFEGVGTALGSFIGGRLYETYGGFNTFRWFGYGSLVCCFFHVIAQLAVKIRNARSGVTRGYTAVIRYEQPTDTVYMLDEMHDARVHDI